LRFSKDHLADFRPCTCLRNVFALLGHAQLPFSELARNPYLYDRVDPSFLDIVIIEHCLDDFLQTKAESVWSMRSTLIGTVQVAFRDPLERVRRLRILSFHSFTTVIKRAADPHSAPLVTPTYTHRYMHIDRLIRRGTTSWSRKVDVSPGWYLAR